MLSECFMGNRSEVDGRRFVMMAWDMENEGINRIFNNFKAKAGGYSNEGGIDKEQ